MEKINNLLGMAKKELRWMLFGRFPNVFPFPHYTNPTHWEGRDLEENISTRVPLDEKLSFGAVCAAEVYGPSEIEKLYDGLKILGWDKPRMDSIGSIEWLKNQRRYGGGGNFNIGVVTRREDSRFLRKHFAPMSEETDYLMVEIFQISPSLTCVVIYFNIKEDKRILYEEALQKNRRMVPLPDKERKVVRYFTAIDLKRRAVEEARAKYRSIAVEWFSAYLPGFFCLNSGSVGLPTAEVLITKKYRLFEQPERLRRPFFDWHNLVFNGRLADVWSCSDCTGFQGIVGQFDGSERYHSIFALRHTDLDKERLEYIGGDCFEAYMHYCHQNVSPFLAYYAGLVLLQEVSALMKSAQERIKSNKGTKSPLSVLEGIKNFISVNVGMPTVARELIREAETGDSYRFYCVDYTAKPFRQEEVVSLIDAMRKRVKLIGELFISEEEVSREQFEQLSSVISTRESVKAQKKMELLTVVALLVAVASLIAALPSVAEWGLSLDFVSKVIGYVRGVHISSP